VLVLIFKSDRRATDPPPKPIISPNISNQDFEIATARQQLRNLFNVVGRSRNYVFEGDNNPPPPKKKALKERVVSYALGV